MSTPDDGTGPWPAPGPPIEPMTATYSLSRREFVWAWRRLIERSEMWRPWQTHLFGVTAAAIGVFSAVRQGWTWFSVLLVALSAIIYLVVLIQLVLPHWMFRRIPADRATQRLVVAPAAIESGTEEYRVSVPWSSVREVIRGDVDGGEVVVLPVLDAHDAFIVPLRVFDAQQRARFEALVARWSAIARE